MKKSIGKVKDRHLVSSETQSLGMPKITFQPGLKFLINGITVTRPRLSADLI